jgi:hypothetical protein
MSTTVSMGYRKIPELYGKQLVGLIPDPSSVGKWVLVFYGSKDGIGSIAKCTNAELAKGKVLETYAIHSDKRGLDLFFADDVCVTIESDPESITVTTGYALPLHPLKKS